MLERWMPFGTFQAANPVFRFGVRRLRFGRSAETLNRRSRALILRVSALVLALWLLLVIGEYLSMSCARVEPVFCYYPLVSVSRTFAIGLALLSIGCDVLLDFVCILAGYNTMRMDSDAVHWDLLRLTPMHLEAIINAQHAVAQTRAWLVSVLVVALRIDVLILVLVTAFALPFIFLRNLGDVIGFGYDFLWLSVVTALVLTAFISVIEPLWRMRAMTALGIGLAARFREPTMAILAAAGNVVGLWIVELIVLGLTWAVSLMTASVFGYFTPVFIALISGGVIWIFFRNLTARGLTRAIRHTVPQ